MKKSFPNAPSPAGVAMPLRRAPCRRVPAATPSACGSVCAAARGGASAAYKIAAWQHLLRHRHGYRHVHHVLPRLVARFGCAQDGRVPGVALRPTATRAPWRRVADRHTLRLLCSVTRPKIPRVLRRPPRHAGVTPQFGGRLALECPRGTQQLANSDLQAFGGVRRNRERRGEESRRRLPKIFGARRGGRGLRSRGPARLWDAASKYEGGLTTGGGGLSDGRACHRRRTGATR